jgi:hypothetical protein
VHMVKNGCIMKLFKIIAVVGLLVFLPRLALAFEPKWVDFRVSYPVENPKEYIGYFTRLMGDAMNFEMNYEEPGEMHVVLWVPDVWSSTKNITAKVSYLDENRVIRKETLSLPEDEWVFYHDDFTGNDYYKGPELHVGVSSGTHVVEISTKSNEDSFLLILGNEEIDTSWRSMLEWGKIKNDVYAEFPLKAFYNVYGIIVLVGVVVIVAIIVYLGVWEYLRIKKADEAEEIRVDKVLDSEKEDIT